jgi:hypothetical protein
LIGIRVPVDLLDRHARPGPSRLSLFEHVADREVAHAHAELMVMGRAIGFLDRNPVGARPFRCA